MSTKNKKPPVPDDKNHTFAKDGFTYRTVYFQDFDGSYYKISLSIGEDNGVSTVYNVGKIKTKTYLTEKYFPQLALRPICLLYNIVYPIIQKMSTTNIYL